MSLYNALHGTNGAAPMLMEMLGIDQKDGKWPSGRFRDAFLNADGTRILLYTRNGGGNRSCWSYGDEKCDGRCPGCIITNILPKHPNYVRDYDDDFDCTYATVEFSVPDGFLSVTKAMADGKEPKTISEMFKDTMEEMSSMTKEEIEKDERFGPLVRRLLPALEGDSDCVISV